MKLISHRGNIIGPKLENENKPSYIDAALKLGYDVEIDVRFVEGSFWLGHDYPQYKINKKWMDVRKDKLWFHCKDIYSALEMSKMDYKFFCHISDDYVLTSTNHLWVHDLSKSIDDRCIIPLLSLEDIMGYNNDLPYAICTDYINECSKKYPNG